MADDHAGHLHHHDNAAVTAAAPAIDPVCGMTVDLFQHHLDRGEWNIPPQLWAMPREVRR